MANFIFSVLLFALSCLFFHQARALYRRIHGKDNARLVEGVGVIIAVQRGLTWTDVEFASPGMQFVRYAISITEPDCAKGYTVSYPYLAKAVWMKSARDSIPEYRVGDRCSIRYIRPSDGPTPKRVHLPEKSWADSVARFMMYFCGASGIAYMLFAATAIIRAIGR